MRTVPFKKLSGGGGITKIKSQGYVKQIFFDTCLLKEIKIKFQGVRGPIEIKSWG